MPPQFAQHAAEQCQFFQRDVPLGQSMRRRVAQTSIVARFVAEKILETGQIGVNLVNACKRSSWRLDVTERKKDAADEDASSVDPSTSPESPD